MSSSQTQPSQNQDSNSKFANLFRCAKRYDYGLMLTGTFLAALQGIGIPVFSILWGNLVDTLAGNQDPAEAAKTVMLQFLYLGLAVLFTGWGSYVCWTITGMRQSIECRKLYLQRLLKQEIGWYDAQKQEQISLRFSADCMTYEKAIGENFFNIVMIISMMGSGIVISFLHGWLMALVIIGSLPILILSYYLYGKAVSKKNQIEEQAFEEVGRKMDEVFSSIQTVKLLNGQQYQSKKFTQVVEAAKNKICSFVVWMAPTSSLSFLFLTLTLTLGFWYGSKCVTGESGCMTSEGQNNRYKAGNALLILFSLLLPAISFNQIIVSYQKINEGMTAAGRIFSIIDRTPLIESSSDSLCPSSFEGNIIFQQVTFAYPNAKDKLVLDKLSMEINLKSAAIIGHSGCGKSTIFQLIMRFYDPDSGRITLDGIDLKKINVEWLRRQIGYVGQEPVLFGITVRENLLLANPQATEDELIKSLKEAEAYDFVFQFAEKLDANVGQGGSLISGGQKQRLAIARAILKKPKLLLLDEATSSLDLKNEASIQQTLAKISDKIRTITIAHRHNTIINSDIIYCLKEGKIYKSGTYKSLLQFCQENFEQQNQIEQQPPMLPSKVPISQLSTAINNPESIFEQDYCHNKEDPRTEVSLMPLQSTLVEKTEGPWSRLFSYWKQYQYFLVFICIISGFNGIVLPLFSLFIGKILAIQIQFNPNDPDESLSNIHIYSICGVVISVVGFLFTIAEKRIFNKIGIEVSSKMRQESFDKILKMDVSFFDKKENSSAELSAIIDLDCKNINKFTSTILMVVLWLFSSIIFGVVLSFIYEWRTTLVSLGCIPLIGLSSFIQLKFASGVKEQIESVFRKSTGILNEAVKGIRTVVSLNGEKPIQNKYYQNISGSSAAFIEKAIISGIFFGMSYMMMYIVIGIAAYLGIIFKINYHFKTDDLFCSILLISFSGLTIGSSLVYFPDINGTKPSLQRIFKILDDRSEEVNIQQKGQQLKTRMQGSIKFNNVTFKYDGEIEPVLKNLSFEVKAGEKVGIVGHSGCGKSTIIKLIEGFYKQTGGNILIDNIKLDDYDKCHLRQSIGVVNQEPVLFNDTIQQNILYNKAGDKETVEKLLKMVNFPPLQQINGNSQSSNWLDKNVGMKGSHISGGQKQRVAILRALYRNPLILLLDEATSALDQQNEQMIMESIWKASHGKTVINVTHRLNTLKDYNQIIVLRGGVAVERGTFEQLLNKKGEFYNLMNVKENDQ